MIAERASSARTERPSTFATVCRTLCGAFALGAASLAAAQQPPVGRPPVLPPGMGTLPKPKAPQTLEQRFADRNQRALQSLEYQQCMVRTLLAGRSGQLGAVPPNDLAVCVQQEGQWRGVFGQFTTSGEGFAVRLQFAVGGKGALVTDPIDTAVVAGAARALVRASSAPFPGSPADEILPVILHQENFYEIWFLPTLSDPARAVVGGDSLIQMSADGSRELGHAKSSAPIRIVQVVAGQPFVLQSAEAELPLLSELLVGNAALQLVPEVRIRTGKGEWTRARTAQEWRLVPRSR